MRGVAPRRVIPRAEPPAPQRVRVCGYRSCHALILSLPGTTPINALRTNHGTEVKRRAQAMAF